MYRQGTMNRPSGVNRMSTSSRMSMQSDRSGGRQAPRSPPRALPNDSVLYLSVVSARDLKKKQKIGVQDPYCAAYIVSRGKQADEPAFRTATHEDGGQTPVWNEKSTIVIADVAADVLRIKVMNENLIGSNTIGDVAIAMRDLPRGQSVEKEYALTPQGFLKIGLYLALGRENPTSQPRVRDGVYPVHFIAGKSKLYVGLICGDKLRSVQAIGKQDPYCEVYLSRTPYPPSSDLIYTSKTHDNGGKNPQWMEGLTFPVTCMQHNYLVIRVIDANFMKDVLIGEMSVRVEQLIGLQFEDKLHPIEADGTIVGQIRLQLALFNDAVLDELDESLHGEEDSCTCASTKGFVVRATKVGDVLINGISPDGVQYLEAGTVVNTGSELAGDYVMDRKFVEHQEYETYETFEDGEYVGNGQFHSYAENGEYYSDSDDGDEL